MNKYDIYCIDLQRIKNSSVEITTLMELETPYLIYIEEEIGKFRFETYSKSFNDQNFVLIKKEDFYENKHLFDKFNHTSNNYTKLLLNEDEEFLFEVLKELNNIWSKKC